MGQGSRPLRQVEENEEASWWRQFCLVVRFEWHYGQLTDQEGYARVWSYALGRLAHLKHQKPRGTAGLEDQACFLTLT